MSLIETSVAEVALDPSTPAPAPLQGRQARRESEPAARGSDSRPGRRARVPLTTGRGIAVWVLVSISMLSLWMVAYAVVLTPFQEARQQAILYNDIRNQLALQVAPLGGAIKPGSPVAILAVPALGISDLVVVEGTSSGDLMAGPGHRRDSVLPGQAGIAIVYGRASLFGGPFSWLGSAAVGDELNVITGQGAFTYEVTGVRRAGDAFPNPLTEGKSRLTLVSAEGTGRFGALEPSATVYVDAMLKGEAQPSPAGRPASVPTAEKAMEGDPSALLPLAIDLPLLLGSAVLLVWARSRWGGWQTWLVGMPMVLASLWITSQAAVQLLPNLL